MFKHQNPSPKMKTSYYPTIDPSNYHLEQQFYQSYVCCDTILEWMGWSNLGHRTKQPYDPKCNNTY